MINQVLKYKNYLGSVKVDTKSKILYGSIIGINDLISYEAISIIDLEKEFKASVNDYLQTCQQIDKNPDKSYFGKFNVRIKPELHKAASYLAEYEGVSLNRIVERAIKEFVDSLSSIEKV